MAVAIEINDRRRRRSDEQDTALRYQLEQVIQDFHLTSCVLSDTEGRVLAEAHDFDDEPEAPTAVDPMIAGHDHRLEWHAHRRHRRHRLRGVPLGGRPLFITAQGQDDSMREVALYRVVLGAKRIYKECVNAASAH